MGMRHVLDAKHVAGLLRQLRTECGLSQEALGGRSGLHRTYIGLIERGERNPTITTISRILPVLGTSWADFGTMLDRLLEEADDEREH